MANAEEMNRRSKRAAKWSFATELIAKVISPISQLILARLLAPEAFGMVATVTMVVNFADMFSDAGFQKYLVQKEFSSDSELRKNANVAFWTNFCVSVALWIAIAVFRDPVSSFFGNPSLGIPLAIACLSLPLTSFSSVQRALFVRGLDFKSMMPVRLGMSLITFFVTVSLALLGFDYWSLIAGTLAGNAFNAIALTIKSDWKPRLFYSADILKAMFSFSSWTLLESFSVWLSVWAGTFIVGNVLGSGDLGLYKTPVTFVSGCFAIVTNATTPILFSSLSRLQDDKVEFLSYFYRFQFLVGLVLLPLSLGIFVFREPLVLLLLGDQWTDAAMMFGLYGLLQGPMVVFSYYCSEMYRALGKPRVSTFVQILFMLFMVPALYWAATNGFEAVVCVDAVTRMFLIIVNQVVAFFVVGVSFISMLKSMKEPIIATAIMGAFSLITSGWACLNYFNTAVDIVCCILVYAAALLAFAKTRKILFGFIRDPKSVKFG